MNRVEIQEEERYGDEFWPGFVDILSGLILIFSFLILVAGIVLAVIYQVHSTVKIPTTKFTHVLAIAQQSPLVVPAQYGIIEEIKREKEQQVLVRRTKQVLEDIAEKTNRILNDFPDLKRQLEQEIRFLQEEIRLVKVSPPPEGKTQKAVDRKGGTLANAKGIDNLPATDSDNWEIVDNEGSNGSLFITFRTPNSLPPTEAKAKKLRATLQRWISINSESVEPELVVANAVVPYAGIASRDSLRRALFLRELMQTLRAGVRVRIVSTENNREAHPNGWIEIRP